MPKMLHAVAPGLVLLLAAALVRPAYADPPQPILPLRSVRLYETGVGYFQREGTLAPGSHPTLPVPAAHLDDALQTLVILTAPGSGTEVSSVEFASSVSGPAARALVGLPDTDGAAPIGFRDLLVSLKGEGVEIRTAAGATRGRLLDVVTPGPGEVATPEPAPSREHEPARPAPPPPLTLVIVTERSEIQRVKATDVTSIRPTDASVATRLSSALDALSGQGHQTSRPLRVSATGSGPVTLGYIAETPVWRTTYRLVEDAGGANGVLQGWALLHNDTDEEWADVAVQLVNGRPDSFLFPLAAPRYARRELVHPDDDLSTVPQLVGRTVDSMWDPIEGGESTGLGLGGVGGGSGFGLAGHGSAAPSIRVGVAASGSVGSSNVLDVGNLAPTPQATGVESGALFRYALKDPVHLGAHASLLVPFVQARVDAELLAWFAAPGEPARAGVRVVNATQQTLPAGTIAFFADGGFAGESALPRLEPTQKRVILYGADLDVALSCPEQSAREQIERLVTRGDDLEEHFVRTTDSQYEITNRSNTARAVYLPLAVGRNARATGADRIEFDDATSSPLLVFHVDALATKPEKVTTVEGLERSLAVSTLDAAALDALSKVVTLPAEQRSIVAEAAARAREEGDASHALGVVRADLEAKERDVTRFRADLSAAGGSHANGAFAARLSAAEDALESLRARGEQLSDEVSRKEAEKRAALARLKP